MARSAEQYTERWADTEAVTDADQVQETSLSDRGIATFAKNLQDNAPEIMDEIKAVRENPDGPPPSWLDDPNGPEVDTIIEIAQDTWRQEGLHRTVTASPAAFDAAVGITDVFAESAVRGDVRESQESWGASVKMAKGLSHHMDRDSNDPTIHIAREDVTDALTDLQYQRIERDRDSGAAERFINREATDEALLKLDNALQERMPLRAAAMNGETGAEGMLYRSDGDAAGDGIARDKRLTLDRPAAQDNLIKDVLGMGDAIKEEFRNATEGLNSYERRVVADALADKLVAPAERRLALALETASGENQQRLEQMAGEIPQMQARISKGMERRESNAMFTDMGQTAMMERIADEAVMDPMKPVRNPMATIRLGIAVGVEEAGARDDAAHERRQEWQRGQVERNPERFVIGPDGFEIMEEISRQRAARRAERAEQAG